MRKWREEFTEGLSLLRVAFGSSSALPIVDIMNQIHQIETILMIGIMPAAETDVSDLSLMIDRQTLQDVAVKALKKLHP